MSSSAGRRETFEVPVGFKWFVEGLAGGDLGFVCEESAGATLVRRGGGVWTTDKDGIAASLLSAEIMAATGLDLADLYDGLTDDLGRPVYRRETMPADARQRQTLRTITAEELDVNEVGGARVERTLTEAPGNGAPIGGIKFVTSQGWLAMRPSGTEDVVKVYAESFEDEKHASGLLEEGRALIAAIVGE